MQCNHVVDKQYICVVQAFLICSPCSPFTATSAHSSSLLPSLVAPATLTVLPSIYPGLLLTILVFRALPSIFIPGSIDLLMAHIGTESPHVCICASVYARGGYGLNFIIHSLDHTHPIRLGPLINGEENRASKVRADHTTAGKLADADQDIVVAFTQQETL